MKLLVGSRNRHKLSEIREILVFPWLEIVGPDDIALSVEVEEKGDTFEANAVHKAVTLAKATGLWTMADDSGLEVFALNGLPGVYSARYAGEPVDYVANNRKLLAELRGVKDRRARFRCVLVLSNPFGEVHVVEGICDGVITEEPRGTGGFGYDPIFVPEGFTLTFAEMAPDLKNSISHRGRALRRAKEEWFGPDGPLHVPFAASLS